MRLFWNDLLEVVWPKRWMLCTRLATGEMVPESPHRTKADAVMHMSGINQVVLSVEELNRHEIQFRS